jgi:hypothetical protein
VGSLLDLEAGTVTDPPAFRFADKEDVAEKTLEGIDKR